MMGYELIRQVILELSDRWALGDDIFFLARAELDRFPQAREELEDTIAARKVRHKAVQRLEMPDVIDSQNLENLGLPEEVAETTDHLQGDGVAAGVGTGKARIVFDPREAGELGVGYVLVCPSTDPGWASLFADARGLIVERGGALSHGAIVARDFGIPAVVYPQATSRIPESAVIRVDGNRGIIAILED
jgi:pyruvate,water dikinase